MVACFALALPLFQGCAAPAHQAQPSARAAVALRDSVSLYLRLLEAFLEDRDLTHPSSTHDAYLAQFRYVGSFIRQPEGTAAHVCVASVDVPASNVLHGYSELLVQDDDGRIIYRVWPNEMNVCVTRGELRRCAEGGGDPLDESCLLRLEHPGVIELLKKENLEACDFKLINYDRMTVEWKNQK